MFTLFKRTQAPQLPPQATMTLLQILENFYAVYANITGQTVKRYRCELGRFERVVGPIPINEITIETYDRFRQACLKEGLAHDSIEGSVKISKALLRYCRDRGWIQALPLFGKPLRLATPDPKPATNAELTALWDACKFAEYPGRGVISPCEWWRRWFIMDWFTALRLQDSFSLAPNHVQGDSIEYIAAKTQTLHRYPLPDPIIWSIDVMRLNDGPTFFGKHSTSRIGRELEKLCAHAKIRRLVSKNVRQAGVTAWSKADKVAGQLIHGSGVSHVMKSYLGVLDILSEAMPKLDWPEPFLDRPRILGSL